MPSPPIPSDFARADPKHVQVVFENARVRVLRVQLGSFDQTEPHRHPEGVGVFLTDFDLENTEATGRTEVSRGRTGEIRWFAPVVHTTKNLSSRPMQLLMIELKR